jgi:hypothetical protein
VETALIVRSTVGVLGILEGDSFDVNMPFKSEAIAFAMNVALV